MDFTADHLQNGPFSRARLLRGVVARSAQEGAEGLASVKQMDGALLCIQGKRPGVKWETFTYRWFCVCTKAAHLCAGDTYRYRLLEGPC